MKRNQSLITKPDAVLITGASSGIGKEFAHIAASEGHNIVITARSKQDLLQLKKELAHINIDARVAIITADLSEPSKAKQLYNTVRKKYTITHLINNAGFGDKSEFAFAEPDRLTDMIELNVQSLTALARIAARDMRDRGGGYILNVASTASFVPGPNMAVYYATKHYVLALSEAIHTELKGAGVRVTALCPGPTQTHFADAAQASESRLFRGSIPGPHPVARYGWESLHKNRAVAVFGWKNKLMTLMVRFIPRIIIRQVVQRLQK